jgi:hypothetical protein
MIKFNVNFDKVVTQPAPVAESPYQPQDVNTKAPSYQVIKPQRLPAGTPAGTIKIS